MKLENFPDMFPVLDIGDYILRGIRMDDAEAYYEYISDPEVTRLTSIVITSFGNTKSYIPKWIERFKKKESILWAIATKSDDRVIGVCNLFNWDVESSRAEIGYHLARKYWNKGIMTATIKAITRYAFETLNFNRIEAMVMVGNSASAKVLEKVGFKKEGTLREYIFTKGKYHDYWIYSLLKKEWAENQ